MTSPSDVTLFFVVQPGTLSLKGRLLAASLRKFGSPDLKIRACLPIGHDDVSAETTQALDGLGVECVRFEPRIWEEFNYPIGNKLDAACTSFDTPFAAFLDTDIVAIRPFRAEDMFSNDLTARTIMGRQNYTEDVRDVMSDFVVRTLGETYLDLTEEQAAVQTPVEIAFPVYNSGVVCFATGKGIAERWRELTYAVLRDEALPEGVKLPFADQTSLALLALEMRERFSTIDRKWNSQLNLKGLDAFFIHYFKLFALLDSDIGSKTVAMLDAENAPKGLNLLGEISRKDLSYFRAKHRDPTRKNKKN